MRREAVRLLQEADQRLDDRCEASPLGPGILSDVHALVDDGVQSAQRDHPHRARTCLSRAQVLLNRRMLPDERGLAAFLLLAFLLLVLRRLASAQDDETTAAERGGSASAERRQLGPALGKRGRRRAHAGDFDALRGLARESSRSARREEAP